MFGAITSRATRRPLRLLQSERRRPPETGATNNAASGGAMLSMPRAPSPQHHPRVLATGGGVPRRVASRSHSSAAAHSQRALLSDSEPPAAVEASGASPSATALGGNAATYERDLLSIAEGVCAATGGVGGAAAARVVDRSWHASLASPSPLALHTGEPMPMPQLRLVAPLSAYEGPMGTKAAAGRLQSLRSSEAEFARNMASQQSRGRGRGSGGGGALALVAKKREEDLAANQIISDQVIALWEAAEALQSSPATTNTLSSSTSFPTPAASSSSLSNAALALISSFSSSASAALGDRIRLSLAAAVAAVSSGAHDDDVLRRIVVSLRRDCVAADAAIRPDRGTATAGAAKSSGDSSPPIRLSYFAQSLVRICAAASAAALPSLASCLAQTLANDLTEGAHRIHQENAVADSGDGDVGSEAIRQWLRGASDAFVELNVCLDALRKSSGSGGSAVGGGAENKEKQKGGGTAKGAGGHLARSAALRDSGVGTAAAISAAVDFLAAYASAAAVLITFEATNASSSSATTREEKNATPILPPPAAPLVSHIISLAEQLGSFAVLEATHAGLVAALPALLTPPTSRAAAAAAAAEEDSVFSAAEAVAMKDVGSSEGLRAAAGDTAEATRASANRLAAAREAIAEIIVNFRPPSSSVLEAADVFGGSIFLDGEEEGGLEGGGALAPRLLVDYYASILRAVATISQQNAEAVVVATTLVVAEAEADPSLKNNNKPIAAANELRPPPPANKEKGSVSAAAQRNVTASAAALSGDAIDVLSIVMAVERPTSHDAALGAHLTRLAQTARTALSATAGALARTCPARILALYEGSRTVGDEEGIGPIGVVAALRPSAAVMDAFVASGRYDEAIATLALIGGAKPDGWATPPPDVLAAAHRLSLAVGQFGAPRHVAALVPAIYSFRSQHMWLGVFLDYCTAGLAVRVKVHADLCADLAAKAAASSQHFTATFAGGEAAARQRAADAAVVAARDMIVAVALQRSADTSADPLLELLQECCWHPHPRAAPLLVNAVVDNFDHLFAAYPLTYRYKAVDASTVPREHKSRSGGWQGQGGGGHHLVAPATVCAETTMRLAGGSYLRHSVLAFLRDNKQTALFEELVAAWQRPAEEVARLLSRAPDSAPAAQLWECRSCKRLSNARYMYCSCSALRFGSVICPSCGLGQAETNGDCVACGYSFAAEGAITDEMVVPRAPWTCAGCGCANSPYQTIFCGRCKTATGPLAVALGATPQTCSSCSSTNELGFGLYPTCVDCGAPSPAFSLAKNDAKSADEQQQQPLKAWQCDGCGEWSPTSLSRCPHCPYVELRGASPVRDVAPIGCSACGVLNTNGLLAHCCACDAPLVASAPTTVALCTECFTANAKDAASCASCEAVFVRETSSSPSTTVKTAADGAPPPNPNHIVVKSFFRFCKSCSSPVSPYNLSCVCDRCDAFLPFFTTATGEPVPDTAPDAVGVVATCETILRRIDREPESVIIPIAEGFLVELTAASEETIAIARPLLTDVIVHFGHVFRLDSLIGCRGLALSLALAHHCRCEITEGRLVELDRRVVTAFNKQREHDAQRTAHPLLEALAPIASFVAGSSSAATAHNTASLLFCASVANATPGEGARVVAAADVESEEEKHLSRHTRDDEQLCSKCLSPHKESMCRFNDCGWQCGGCGESLTNRNGLDAVLCPKCYQVRPELEECIEVWQCPQCGRCSPDTELFCLFCETHKEVAARGRPEGVYALPFLPVVCGRCSRPHLEALCPHCTAIPPTRVKEGLGTVTVATERYVFLQPLGTSAPEDRVFVPIQLAGELFVDQQVIFDAEEGKPGQLKATRVAPFDD